MTTIRFGEIEIGTQFTFAGVSLKKTNDYNATTTGDRNKRVWQFSKSNRVQITQTDQTNEPWWAPAGLSRGLIKNEVDLSEVIDSMKSTFRHFCVSVRGHITEFYIDGMKYAETAGTLGQAAGKRIIRFPDFMVEGKTISGLEVRFTRSFCQFILDGQELACFNLNNDYTQISEFTTEFYFELYSRNHTGIYPVICLNHDESGQDRSVDEILITSG